MSFVFFFQAEDGIRDLTVTGVQTCALPIFAVTGDRIAEVSHRRDSVAGDGDVAAVSRVAAAVHDPAALQDQVIWALTPRRRPHSAGTDKKKENSPYGPTDRPTVRPSHFHLHVALRESGRIIRPRIMT